jgi:hypothetical protein
VEKGFLNVEPGPSEPEPESSTAALNSEHSTTVTTHSESLPTLSAQAQPSTSTPTHETVERLARKRVADSLAECRPAKKARKRRTCIKCAELTCSGSQTVKNCKNPCRDCRETIGCKGRNSKRPSTLCHLAWD